LGRLNPYSLKTERLVWVETDRRTDRWTWLDHSSSDADQEYTYFMGSETSA